jgi:hypothetical protein
LKESSLQRAIAGENWTPIDDCSALARRALVVSTPAAWHSRMRILCARELPRGSGLCQDLSVYTTLLVAIHIVLHVGFRVLGAMMLNKIATDTAQSHQLMDHNV